MTRYRGRLDYVKIISEIADVCMNTHEYVAHTCVYSCTSSSILSPVLRPPFFFPNLPQAHSTLIHIQLAYFLWLLYSILLCVFLVNQPLIITNKDMGFFGGSVIETELPMQGTQVLSLIKRTKILHTRARARARAHTHTHTHTHTWSLFIYLLCAADSMV